MKMNALKAIADQTRRDILRLVRKNPASVGEIASHFDATQQAISQHLKILKDAGLVESQREGTRHLFLVRPEGFEPVASFLEEFWPQRLGDLKRSIEENQKKRKTRMKK